VLRRLRVLRTGFLPISAHSRRIISQAMSFAERLMTAGHGIEEAVCTAISGQTIPALADNGTAGVDFQLHDRQRLPLVDTLHDRQRGGKLGLGAFFLSHGLLLFLNGGRLGLRFSAAYPRIIALGTNLQTEAKPMRLANHCVLGLANNQANILGRGGGP